MSGSINALRAFSYGWLERQPRVDLRLSALPPSTAASLLRTSAQSSPRAALTSFRSEPMAVVTNCSPAPKLRHGCTEALTVLAELTCVLHVSAQPAASFNPARTTFELRVPKRPVWVVVVPSTGSGQCVALPRQASVWISGECCYPSVVLVVTTCASKCRCMRWSKDPDTAQTFVTHGE